MHPLESALARYFGKKSFRPGQKEVIQDVINGRDVLAIWPTGAGKSLVYQLPALILPNLTIVVSPLIALMQDQVRSLHDHHIDHAACLTSAQTYEERSAVLQGIRANTIKLLFVSPEKLSSEEFLAELDCAKVSLLAIDEAHCLSQWGHDFRPDYLALGRVVQRLNPRSILAVTATATPPVQHQIITYLGMRNHVMHSRSLDRHNLQFSASRLSFAERTQAILARLWRPDQLPAVVYATKRSETQRLGKIIGEHGIRALHYHAGMTTEERASVQTRFQNGETDVIVATIAFGMGIDKQNIRQVIHSSPPPSLEAYYQEAGRAGRDGEFASCHLLYDAKDFISQRQHIASKYPPREVYTALYSDLTKSTPAQLRTSYLCLLPSCWRLIMNTLLGPHYEVGSVQPPRVGIDTGWEYIQALQDAEHSRLDEMFYYASASRCRRQKLLNYFGESAPQNCMSCDNCLYCQASA